MSSEGRLRAALANLVRHIEKRDYVDANGDSLRQTQAFVQAKRVLAST